MHVFIDLTEEQRKRLLFSSTMGSLGFGGGVLAAIIIDTQVLFTYTTKHTISVPLFLLAIIISTLIIYLEYSLILLNLETRYDKYSLKRFWDRYNSQNKFPQIFKIFDVLYNESHYICIRFKENGWHIFPKVFISIGKINDFLIKNNMTIETLITIDFSLNSKLKQYVNINDDVIMLNRLITEQPLYVDDIIHLTLPFICSKC